MAMNADLVRELERESEEIVLLAQGGSGNADAAEHGACAWGALAVFSIRQGILDAIRSEEDAVDRWMGRTPRTIVLSARDLLEIRNPTNAPREEE